MKIVLLGNNNSVHIQKWVKAISLYPDVELHVITFPGGLEFENISYHPLKKISGKRIDYLLNIFNVRKTIKTIGPDIVHAHYATSYGLLAAMSGFHPLIITGWGADIFDSPGSILMRKMLKYSLSKADAITVLSLITKNEILKYTDKQVFIIPFGVDINIFKPKEFKNETSNLIIGTIRTLSEKYGVEYLIKAFLQLEEKYPSVELHIVGDGPQRGKLEELAKLSCRKNSIIFHGFISQTREPQRYINLLRNFDIFSIPSVIDSETFGVAAVEASACGIPVVASKVGGLVEVIHHNESGIIVAPRNAEELALALDALLKDAKLRSTFGANGRRIAETYYNWGKNVNSMIDLYKNTIGKKND